MQYPYVAFVTLCPNSSMPPIHTHHVIHEDVLQYPYVAFMTLCPNSSMQPTHTHSCHTRACLARPVCLHDTSTLFYTTPSTLFLGLMTDKSSQHTRMAIDIALPNRSCPLAPEAQCCRRWCARKGGLRETRQFRNANTQAFFATLKNEGGRCMRTDRWNQLRGSLICGR